jgi:hypothetical protein
VAIKDWRDGSGREWKDAIVHVALTPLPVAHGVGGFAPSGAACTRTDGPVTLSLSSMLYTLGEAPMAEENDKPEGAEGGAKDHFAEGLAVLSRMGVSLPDDTTPENFWERVVVAGHALENADGAAPEVADEIPDEPEESAEYAGEDEPVVEESRPVMMSLATAKTPGERALLAEKEEAHKAAQLSLLDRLVKRGLSPATAGEIREQIAGYSLSLDGEYRPVRREVDRLLSTLDASLPRKHPLAGARTAQEVRRPTINHDPTPQEIKARARAVSAVPDKGD